MTGITTRAGDEDHREVRLTQSSPQDGKKRILTNFKKKKL